MSYEKSSTFVRYNTATTCLGSLAFMLGSASAVSSCIFPVEKHSIMVYPLLSTSITIGIIQLVLILNKADVMKAMVCTACAMLAIVMAVAAPFLPIVMACGCYKGVCIPILFLFWNTLYYDKHFIAINVNEIV